MKKRGRKAASQKARSTASESRRAEELSAGPITLQEARAYATGKVGPLLLSPALADASVERIGIERTRLEARQDSEIEHRIKVYEVAYNALHTHGIQGGPKGPAAGRLPPLRLVAQGDSWFDYPLGKRGIIPRLEKRLGVNILNLARRGDEIRFMLGVKQRKDLEKVLADAVKNKSPFDALLFSGGGNDVVDNPMCLWIEAWKKGKPPQGHLDAKRFGGILSVVQSGYEDLLEIRARVSPNTWIYLHDYDFAIPDGRGVCGVGPWLKPSLDYRGVPTQSDGEAIVRAMLQEFSKMLQNLVKFVAKTRFIKTQGTLAVTDWANELHPSDKGFDTIADLFHKALKTDFPRQVK